GADFLGVVTDCKNGEITISAKAKFIKGETVSVFEPGLKRTDITLDAIYDDKGAEVENTRPNYVYKFKFSGFAEQGSLLMRF
ncbi:MAG: U32 family peptidase C-terminal domain-containing protein, partial [Deferribacterales bacterium]|nr:U32 family peptidase C-terminal domain-containing protein [Deferribacterales bacterium]